MAQQVAASIENNFTKGLITEFTGLNFPENAATDTDNCTYTIVGDVTRRLGIDLEANFQNLSVNRTGSAENSFVWKNTGGTGNNEVLVLQIGLNLYFYS